MTYSVLALDQAMCRTGWAHYRAGDPSPTWGLFELPPWLDDEGRHLWQFFEWLGHKCTDLEVTHLFVEDTRFSFKNEPGDGRRAHEETLSQMLASIGLIAQAAIVAHVLENRGQTIEFAAVSPIDWRREFLGAMHKPGGIAGPAWRKMLKEEAVAQCHKRGWLAESDDIADALGILTFGVCTVDDTFRLKQGPLFGRASMALEDKVREL